MTPVDGKDAGAKGRAGETCPLSDMREFTEDSWIKYLDDILLQPEFESFMVSNQLLTQGGLGNKFVEELQSLSQTELNSILQALKPLEISDIASQQATLMGLRNFCLLASWLDKNFGAGLSNLSERIADSIRFNMEAYFFSLYLRESLVRALLSLQKNVITFFWLKPRAYCYPTISEISVMLFLMHHGRYEFVRKRNWSGTTRRRKSPFESQWMIGIV